MKRTFFFIMIFFLTFFVFGCSKNDSNESGTTSEAGVSEVDSSTNISSEYNASTAVSYQFSEYEIKIPPTWEAVEESEFTYFYVNDGFYMLQCAYAGDVDSGWQDDFYKGMIDGFDSCDSTSKQSITINGLDALQLSVSGQIEGTDVTTQGYSVYDPVFKNLVSLHLVQYNGGEVDRSEDLKNVIHTLSLKESNSVSEAYTFDDVFSLAESEDIVGAIEIVIENLADLLGQEIDGFDELQFQQIQTIDGYKLMISIGFTGNTFDTFSVMPNIDEDTDEIYPEEMIEVLDWIEDNFSLVSNESTEGIRQMIEDGTHESEIVSFVKENVFISFSIDENNLMGIAALLNEETSSESSIEEPLQEESSVPDVPSEYLSALEKAKSYNEFSHMSKQGLYDQLTSEYGEQFSAEAAQYAIDNLDADYMENALLQAESYLELSGFSKQGLYDQLTSEYGEQFTAEEAQYAVDNVEVDWNEEALESALSYQENLDMSPEEIYDQLISEYGEKFTPEEAQYAIDNLS
mgnify:FL=1|nr:MAG TPA: Host cell surface-exposed lipoprotein [Caudoviricetes sp.]